MLDLHTHTTYSDGDHTPEKIILNSIENGVRVIGISDHHKAFFMEKPKLKPFEDYIDEINYLKKKYKDKIEVKAGIEINLNFNEVGGESRIPYEKLSKTDFVLLERIDGLVTFEDPNRYHVKLKDIGRIVEKINSRIGLAHTDLFKLSEIYSEGKGTEYGMDYVISILKKYNIFWELNTRAEHKYFDYIIGNWDSPQVIKLFKKLREQNIEITASTDTHSISDDFNIKRLRLANMVASGEIVPGIDQISADIIATSVTGFFEKFPGGH
ncbi:PHP domain-containing protein [Clostridium algoriphilum]|uniref:PHP domain-containing protein n=1 Tax=Clostridium algoriphilum TaxID=198347 RepID=UPI001CF277D4|nr:PHP domain-containing protein [Clostridium algoriphilum]MCB2292647.1 PHP domain-containing protein [Clostridium algoriphilum]